MRSWFMIAVVLTVLASASPAVAFADHPPAGDAGKSVGVEVGLFRGAIEVSLWTILVFLILMSVLRKYAWGPIREGLDKREQGIAHDKHEAILAKQEAEKLRAELAAEMQKVNDRIREMMDKATKDAAAAAAAEIARGKAEVAAERERVLREVRLAKDDALAKLWEQSTQLATLISTKAVGKNLSESDHRALLGEALAEFRAAAESRKENLESAHA
jgi:F-type H+-transporting ATPase subunit b